MRTPSKDRHARDMNFKTAIEELLAGHGATYSEKFRDWHITTAAGPLKISLDTDGELYTVFCRFESESAHKKFPHLGINPYSGKYNFHLTAPSGNHELTLTISQAWAHIARVLP